MRSACSPLWVIVRRDGQSGGSSGSITILTQNLNLLEASWYLLLPPRQRGRPSSYDPGGELIWLLFRAIAPDFSLKAVAREGKTRPNADARIRSLKTGGRNKKNRNQEHAAKGKV